MARKSKTGNASNWIILLAEDDADYAHATVTLLEREGHTVLWADSGAKALEVLKEQHVDLLLLDYFMPGMTGEETVLELRKFNTYTQVILQTGYASEQPPRELLKRLDIQGYHDKSEGPEKLLMWTDIGLKSAYTVQLLQNSRQGLRYILNATPELHKIQPLDDLLQGIILQVAGLLGNANSFLAIDPRNIRRTDPEESEGFLAIVVDEIELSIHASTGRFAGCKNVAECLAEEEFENVRTTLQQQAIRVIDSATIVPLCVGNVVIGVVYLDRTVNQQRDMELLQVFANQAAVAIQNSQLYEMATLDPLTGVYVRRFFEQWLLREMRAAFRTKRPLSILMVDMDKLKEINDSAGHLGGDRALAIMGKVLRKALRDTDICGRYGGDEFAIVLREPGAIGGDVVAKRIFEFLEGKVVTSPGGDMPVLGSIGMCVLQAQDFASESVPRPIPPSYFEEMAKIFIHEADQALYKAKRAGGGRIVNSESLQWKPFD
ncbi:MAG TPA: diguanylate cyclase [Rhodocyclaceae bacterium]|nr:diguanylate cyclase [Rhodocyclaceae bacterium]